MRISVHPKRFKGHINLLTVHSVPRRPKLDSNAFENEGLATILDSLSSATASYPKEKRATMSRRKEMRKSPPQAYSWCVGESESRTFSNGVCKRGQRDEAGRVYLWPARLCEPQPLTRYSERVSMPSRPRTASRSSWDKAPSTNRAIMARGTQKPSRVRKQLLQRARRFALLVSLLESQDREFVKGKKTDVSNFNAEQRIKLLNKCSVLFFF